MATAGRIIRAAAQRCFEDVVDALLPAACRRCGTLLTREATPSRAARVHAPLYNGTLRRPVVGAVTLPLRFICPPCCESLQRSMTPSTFDATPSVPCVAAFEPCPVLFDLVHALKYEGFVELVPWLAAHLATAAKRALGRELVLVPVPLHAERERQRGFNQSFLLAAAVARRLGCTVAPTALERNRKTAPQAKLDRERRSANVAGAFARRVPLAVGAARIVLVDDVVTTGATARAALDALGIQASPVAVLTLCRAHDDTGGMHARAVAAIAPPVARVAVPAAAPGSAPSGILPSEPASTLASTSVSTSTSTLAGPGRLC